MARRFYDSKIFLALLVLTISEMVAGCAPRVVHINPREGIPGAVVSLEMEYLVGWPRVEFGGTTMDFYQMSLLARDPKRQNVPGKELEWIEDKILQFRVPSLPPGEYTVTIHDDKGPPGDPVWGFLETTAYVIFPPVWPFVLRSNQTQVTFRVLPTP